VKQSAGYGVTRVIVGSLGTLGVLTEVALKVRPVPRARRALIAHGDGLELGAALLAGVPLPAAVLAEAGRVVVVLEGWPEEIAEQTDAALRVTDVEIDDDASIPVPVELFPDAPILAEASVAPSRLTGALHGRTRWHAALGVGTAWVGVEDQAELEELWQHVTDAGGIAPVIRGSGGLGPAPIAASEVARRLLVAFDPGGVLAPGRFWRATTPATGS
jgi:glycolate oxidase FAD binding subunit